MATTRRGTARAAEEEMSMQQVLEIMRGLQDDMADSKIEQERMQAESEEQSGAARERRGGASHSTKGVLYSLLAGDPGRADPQHLRRT